MKTMKKMMTLLAVVGLALGSSHASTILVDLNDAGAAPGATWNIIAAPTGTTALKDTSGSFASGISLSFVHEDTVVNDPNVNDIWRDSTGTGKAGEFSTTAPLFSDAADDYFWVNTDGIGTIVLINVVAGQYKIELVSSQDSDNGGRSADIKVNGAMADSPHNGNGFDAHRDGFDNGSLLVWDSVAPVAGVITIQTVVEAASTDHPYVGTYDVVHEYWYSSNANQNKTAFINAFTVSNLSPAGTVFMFK
jgi:hypothetical protein